MNCVASTLSAVSSRQGTGMRRRGVHIPHQARIEPGLHRTVGKVKQYKYRALVKLSPAGEDRTQASLPETGGRVVVRAEHHDTHRSKVFSALISASYGEPLRPAEHSIQLTMTVLGDDCGDYLDAGDTFALWRGHDIGQGVISRRLPLWVDSP